MANAKPKTPPSQNGKKRASSVPRRTHRQTPTYRDSGSAIPIGVAPKDQISDKSLNNRKKRQRLVERAGGQCVYCGNDRYDDLHFHHLLTERHKKKFGLTVSEMGRCNDAIESELKICVLCCHRCHNLIHSGILWDMSYTDPKYNIVLDKQTGKHRRVAKQEMWEVATAKKRRKK